MQPVSFNLGQKPSPTTPPAVAPAATQASGNVVLNQGVCGVLLMPSRGEETVEPDSFQDTTRSIQNAIIHSTGDFLRIETIPPVVEASFVKTLHSTLISAIRQECCWLFVVTKDCLVHPEAFHRLQGQHRQHEALWGQIVDQQPSASTAYMRVPQISQTASLKDLLLLPTASGVDVGFFVRADVLLNLLNSASAARIVDIMTLCWELWQHAKCFKAPIHLVNLNNSATRSDQQPAAHWQDHLRTLKATHQLVENSPATLARRNELTGSMQELARKQQQHVSTSVVLKQSAWYGYYQIQDYEGENFTMFTHNDDHCVAAIQWQGMYQSASTYVWQRLARKASMILDLGAYTGLYTLLAARANPEACVLGLEPNGRAHARFLINAHFNQLNRVSAIKAAAGHESSRVPLKIFGDDLILDATSSLNDPQQRTPLDTEIVSLVAIDQLLVDHHLPVPELIKIDTPGSELAVFQGMLQTLGHHPDLLCAAMDPVTSQRVAQQLSPFGYHIYTIAESRMAIDQTPTLTPLSGQADDCKRLLTKKSKSELMALLDPNALMAQRVPQSRVA